MSEVNARRAVPDFAALHPGYARCDPSSNKRATQHLHATGHPIIEDYDPPEGWGWGYVDEMVVELDHRTPQAGPIKRWLR
jgi:hypothetical protein